MLDQFKLINRFWRYRRSHYLTSLQADVFYALVHECNDRRWENPFHCKNDRLLELTGIKDTALKGSRNRLAEIGLIGYAEGIRNVQAPAYKLYNTDDEFFADFPDFNIQGTDAFMVVKRPRKPPIIGSNVNGGNDTFASIEASCVGDEKKSPPPCPEPPPTRSFGQEKEKSCAKKEKDGGRPPLKYWRALQGTWYAFNRKHLDIEPAFKGEDPKCFREILVRLEKKTLSDGLVWSESEAINALEKFLESAWEDKDFLAKKFILKNLEKQYDPIIHNQHSHVFTAVPTRGGFSATTNAYPLRGRGGSFARIQLAQRPGAANRPQ